MTDTFGLGSLFQEEGPGRTGAPRLLPVIDAPPFIRKVDDDRSFGDYFQSDKNVIDRVKDYFEPEYEQGSFGSFQRDDDRIVRFGLPEEFSQTEILRALEDIKSSPTGSTLADRRDVTEVAKRLEGLPENDPIFAGSPLDALSADIDKTLADLKTTPSPSAEEVIDKKMDMDASTPSLTQDKIESAAMAAFNDYLEAARGAGPDAPQVKDLDDYKKQFAEATGIDISGKVDKSHALMTFGLALMQNKAGRGFNVGKMLASVGEAGTAALPALQKAKAQARNDAIAAGKYALEARSADEAKAAAAREKAMERTDYFVVPKSDDVKGFLAGLGEGRGRLESLSKYEVDKLLKNPEFAKKFDILPGSTWGTVVAEALKTPDGSALWDDKVQSRSLIPAITEPLLEIDISYGKPGTTTEGQYVVRDAQQIRVAEDQLARMSRDLRKAKQEFIDLGILTGGERNIFTYGIDKLNSLARVAGIEFGSEATETDKINMILKRLQVKNAADILGEAGKTISDGDRALVAEIVGDIKAGSDIRLIREKTQKLFNDIIGNTEQNILQGLQNLSRYSGRDYGLNSDQPMSDEEYEELLRYRKGEA